MSRLTMLIFILFVWANAIAAALVFLGWAAPVTWWRVFGAGAVVFLVGWTIDGIRLLRE